MSHFGESGEVETSLMCQGLQELCHSCIETDVSVLEPRVSWSVGKPAVRFSVMAVMHRPHAKQLNASYVRLTLSFRRVGTDILLSGYSHPCPRGPLMRHKLVSLSNKDNSGLQTDRHMYTNMQCLRTETS
jgi:hypothetical protein